MSAMFPPVRFDASGCPVTDLPRTDGDKAKSDPLGWDDVLAWCADPSHESPEGFDAAMDIVSG